ncbi:MAG: arsenate reductase ArsC, partial [Ktedonobacteraceae bacterium]
MKKRILFICTHNSARSQMAEGLLRGLGGDQFEAFSAGTEATHVRPLAIKAM